MIKSRKLEDLLPVVQEKACRLIEECDKRGIELLVHATYRDNEYQDMLYAKGRATPGQIVTNAKGGETFHNYRCAFDIVPIDGRECVWDNKTLGNRILWETIGEIGEGCGLEWGGRWKSIVDMCHFHYSGGLSVDDLKEGKEIK